MEKYTTNVKLDINPELAAKLEEAQELLKQLTKTIMDMHGLNMLAPVVAIAEPIANAWTPDDEHYYRRGLAKMAGADKLPDTVTLDDGTLDYMTTD